MKRTVPIWTLIPAFFFGMVMTVAVIAVLVVFVALINSASRNLSARPVSVTVDTPASNTTIPIGAGTVIQGEVTGEENIVRVEIVIDDRLYASLATPDSTRGVPSFPVSVPWTPMSGGTHTIQIKAFGPENKQIGQSAVRFVQASDQQPAGDDPIDPACAALPTTYGSGLTPIAVTFGEPEPFAYFDVAKVVRVTGRVGSNQPGLVCLYINGKPYASNPVKADGSSGGIVEFDWIPRKPGAYMLELLVYDTQNGLIGRSSQLWVNTR